MNTLQKLEEVLDNFDLRDGGKDLTILNDVALINKELSELACMLTDTLIEVTYQLNKKLGE